MASAGHAAEQAAQPVQLSVSSSGRKGPPIRGRMEMAVSGQTSRQVMQAIPAFARQSPEICITCAIRRLSAKTSSGQASAQAPQKVHSPASGLSVTPSSAMSRIFSGQASAQAPQDVQAASDCRVTPGGRARNGPGCGRPRNRSRRDMAVSAATSAQCPAGPGGPAISWYIQTRNPYPPTAPTATTGQIPNARIMKLVSSLPRETRRGAGSGSVACRSDNAASPTERDLEFGCPIFRQRNKTVIDNSRRDLGMRERLRVADVKNPTCVMKFDLRQSSHAPSV